MGCAPPSFALVGRFFSIVTLIYFIYFYIENPFVIFLLPSLWPAVRVASVLAG
jgi:hypothetical protein